MNSYQDLAQRLLGRQNTVSGPDKGELIRLKAFLSTAPGHEAARAAVERVIITNRTLGKLKQPTHQEIIGSLIASMGSNVQGQW